MRRLIVAVGLAVSLAAAAAHAQPVEKFDRKSHGEWVYEYKDGRSEVKRERKPGEYKEEIKYRDGVSKFERKADGSWKEEIKDGRCEIKRERTSSGEYKEERKCG